MGGQRTSRREIWSLPRRWPRSGVERKVARDQLVRPTCAGGAALRRFGTNRWWYLYVLRGVYEASAFVVCRGVILRLWRARGVRQRGGTCTCTCTCHVHVHGHVYVYLVY